jgi:hypothetical protein
MKKEELVPTNRGPDFQYTLTDNKALNETSSQFQMPIIIRQTIMSDGYGTFHGFSSYLQRL